MAVSASASMNTAATGFSSLRSSSLRFVSRSSTSMSRLHLVMKTGSRSAALNRDRITSAAPAPEAAARQVSIASACAANHGLRTARPNDELARRMSWPTAINAETAKMTGIHRVSLTTRGSSAGSIR